MSTMTDKSPNALNESRISFSYNEWARVKINHEKWWQGTLGRPLIQYRLGHESNGPLPSVPMKHFTAFYDKTVTPDEIVDCWDYNLSSYCYLSDAFPAIWPNFGPGVAACFAGANLSLGDDTVWFHPEAVKEVDELDITFDASSLWLKRIADIMEAAMKRWQGKVQVGMTDLGGNLDILSTFRPGEELLYDLYDDPDAVKERTWEIHKLWWESYDYLNRILQPINPGYTCWTPIFSETPYYMLQCDFCYMIGPEMFDEFVKPELAECCKKMPRAFYHLDGPGELPHLESLLEIEELDGVQWIPGDGQPSCENWPEVFRKIDAAGKKIQLFGGMRTLDIIADTLGHADNIILITGGSIRERDEVEKWLDGYGAL